ncbi:MAG: hypothetical protein JNL97_08450 [Verrucomicrobiales bacterium]|nr:hypothetical protein [Verrucomicrobiales bacterium]
MRRFASSIATGLAALVAGTSWVSASEASAVSLANPVPMPALELGDLTVTLPPPATGGGGDWAEEATTARCAIRTSGAWLVATLDEPMPADTWLEVEVLGAGPGPGEGSGFQPLSARDRRLTLRLRSTEGIPLRLRYRFRHGLHAAPGSFSRTVIFSLVDS